MPDRSAHALWSAPAMGQLCATGAARPENPVRRSRAREASPTKRKANPMGHEKGDGLVKKRWRHAVSTPVQPTGTG